MATTGTDPAREAREAEVSGRAHPGLLALDDAARRLAGLTEADEVWAEVADAARRLLSADLAAVLLADPDGPARTVAVTGAFGTGLHGLVHDAGLGVAGAVLRTGRPWSTRDYLADPTFEHDPATDLAVSGEHVRAVLAVPLLAAGRTSGVLGVATREPREFDRGDLELAARLAGHAALAAARARATEHHRDVTAGLERANAALRSDARAAEAVHDLRERQSRLLVVGTRFADLVRELRGTVAGTVAAFDADDVLLDGEPGCTLADLTGPGPDGAGGAVVVPVPHRGGPAGCLVATLEPGDDADRVRDLLTVTASSLAVYVATQLSIYHADRRTYRELLAAMGDAEVSEESVLRRAVSARVDVEGITAVAVFDLGATPSRTVASLARRVADELGGWEAEHAGRAVALLSGAGADTVRATVARLTTASPGAAPTVGISGADGGVAGARAAFGAARQTVAVLQALGRDGACVTAGELGVYRALFSTAGRPEIAAFVHGAVGSLLDHDREHGGDLTATLTRYLAVGQNHTRAATELHIHPNTLYRRLSRVDALLGEAWREAPMTLQVQLALHLQELSDRL